MTSFVTQMLYVTTKRSSTLDTAVITIVARIMEILIIEDGQKQLAL
jgi:hypothetical protein